MDGPVKRLSIGVVTLTPAMQAGIFDRPLSWRAVFAWPVKPPTPAQELVSEMRQSHTSRSNVAVRRTIDPKLLKSVISHHAVPLIDLVAF